MDIACLSGNAYPEAGGISTFLHHFLPEAQRRGHTVRQVAFGEPYSGDADLTYPLTRIPFSIGWVRRHAAYLRAARHAAQTSDVVFALSYGGLFMPFVRGGGRRIVHKAVTDWTWEMADRRGLTTLDKVAFQTAPTPLALKPIRAYYLWAMRQADLIYTPSAHMREVVLHWGVPAERVRVIYNAIPAPTLPTTDRRALRAQLGLPTEGRLIVSVARLTPVKGVHVLMKALPAVPDVHAVIVGDGPQRAELEALAPAGQVTFAGQQPHERVLMYLRAADAYVLSSYTEGLSHTLLEAVAVGTPCVATTVGGNPEVITDGREGFLIPPDSPDAVSDAVRRILSDPARLTQMEAACLARSADFRWENEVEQVLDALAEQAR
jgi:glycosyltransferase involved in cell wall biosynthesis